MFDRCPFKILKMSTSTMILVNVDTTPFWKKCFRDWNRSHLSERFLFTDAFLQAIWEFVDVSQRHRLCLDSRNETILSCLAKCKMIKNSATFSSKFQMRQLVHGWVHYAWLCSTMNRRMLTQKHELDTELLASHKQQWIVVQQVLLIKW